MGIRGYEDMIFRSATDNSWDTQSVRALGVKRTRACAAPQAAAEMDDGDVCQG